MRWGISCCNSSDLELIVVKHSKTYPHSIISDVSSKQFYFWEVQFLTLNICYKLQDLLVSKIKLFAWHTSKALRQTDKQIVKQIDPSIHLFIQLTIASITRLFFVFVLFLLSVCPIFTNQYVKFRCCILYTGTLRQIDRIFQTIDHLCWLYWLVAAEHYR